MKLRIISGLYKGHTIFAPNVFSTRPTSSRFREAFFNICQDRVDGCCFLDLFAGCGAMGIEAFSRGARAVSFIEFNKSALSSIRKNLSLFSLEKKAKIYPMDAIKALNLLKKKKERFSLIYCDPPYSLSISLLKEILEIGLDLLEDDGRLFLEFGQDLSGFSIKPESSRKLGKSYLFKFLKK